MVLINLDDFDYVKGLMTLSVKSYKYYFPTFQENMFAFDETDVGLKRILNRKQILIEDLKDLLNGSRISPKIKQDPEGLYDQATVLELIQPATFESPTEKGLMTVK